jgi:hypothetical protein
MTQNLPPNAQSVIKYNQVFERLVRFNDQGAPDVVGLVAYGLYKTAKREWVMQECKTLGRSPNQGECFAYAATQTETVLDGYRNAANMILAAYADSVLQAETPKIRARTLQGSFMRAFWPSFFASAAFALSLVILALILSVSGVGIPIINQR